MSSQLASGPTPSESHRAYLFWHIAACALLILLVAGIQIQGLWQSRLEVEERARLTARNLGNVVAENIAGAFKNIDLVLLSAIDQVRQHRSAGPGDESLINALDDLRRRTPGLIGLHVTDASGQVLYGTGREGTNVNLADRKYFQRLRDHPDAGMVVAGPVTGRIVQKWVLVCSRRIERPDGQFAGIIYGSIEIEGMAERITGKPLQLGDRDIVVMTDNEATLIMRYIDKHQDMQFIGQKATIASIDSSLRSGADDGFARAISPVDGVERIFYFQRIAGQPMNLTVGLATAGVMAGWYREAIYAGIVTVMFALLTAFGSYLIYQGQMRKLRLVAELAESNRRLSDLSMTDSLTGLANRRHFDEVLEREWRRGARSGQPLALAMLDVDFFKKYNDHYGHQGGDECLRALAQVLQQHVHRAGDFIARYGGEEFVILGAGTDGAHAQRLAEGIRDSLEKLALPHKISPFGHITVSIGVAAVVPREQQNLTALIGMADEALYAAKQQGRNRVVSALATD